MARRKKGRPINGIVLVDKPAGWSSNAVLQKVRWLFQAQKAGHTGALDPLATGLLPVCLGEATKFTRFLLDADKAYLTTARLGIRTETLDAEGEVTDTAPVPALDAATIEQLLAERFTGDIEQVPPMYSALKRDGKKLYELAREGKAVELEPRPVTIHALSLERLGTDELDLAVACSKGTYIRTLVDDIGQALGCGAHVSALRRTRHGHFSLEGAISLDALIEQGESEGCEALDRHLLSMDDLLVELPVVELTEGQSRRFSHGNAVDRIPPMDAGQVRVRDGVSGRFLGVGAITADAVLQPVRVVADAGH
ncbi:tRNA pseudouridine(55) synthase TruB [Saccharospirillum salsuginis]|uniref:tRNA pseudouridine synthase B n=1 Tax=Saccharospirillum salsuginis TaxID=418750 RepID=A0A918K2E4_9GAMM|nr:tRNA pseudouridine(55) synthase TruB [Saccharospirillum salsuginis]GGX44831.1 tRNA pseudouridine synthase B [Saccharospirillum salsuginis]